MSRFAAVSLALALIVGGSAATVSAQALIDQPATSPVDIKTPAPGGTESDINVNDPQITARINQLIGAYPYRQAPTQPWCTPQFCNRSPYQKEPASPAVIDSHPQWASYFYNLNYQPATGAPEDQPGIPVEISDVGLSGTIALASVHAWYTYWLNATPKQQRASQTTLDAMQTWPDLTVRLGCQDAYTCPGGIVEIARIARPQNSGDPAPMKRWLSKFNNPTK